MARECIKVQLKSSDGEMFEVDEVVAMESVTLKHMIQDTGNVSVIPLPNVTANILSRVIQYCQYHLVAAKTCEGNVAVNSEEDVKKLDEEFVKVDLSTLFDLILAANYLDIKELLDLTCQAVADIIAGKSPEEIRKIFNIRNDFTAEEEAEIRRENQWAFEEI